MYTYRSHFVHVLRLRRCRPRPLPQLASWCRLRKLRHRNLDRGPLAEKPQREPHKSQTDTKGQTHHRTTLPPTPAQSTKGAKQKKQKRAPPPRSMVWKYRRTVKSDSLISGLWTIGGWHILVCQFATHFIWFTTLPMISCLPYALARFVVYWDILGRFFSSYPRHPITWSMLRTLLAVRESELCDLSGRCLRGWFRLTNEHLKQHDLSVMFA